eukprot:gene22441-22421_t
MTAFGSVQQLLKTRMQGDPDQGLGPLHFRALCLCQRYPGAPQQQLVQAMGRDKGQIARLIRELEQRGLLQRTPAPDDGRVWLLTVTPEGEEKCTWFSALEAQVATELLGKMSAADSVVLGRLAVHGNTLILSGPVVGTELGMVKDAFAAHPKMDLVILRNSHGGDAWTGYRIGELLRDAGVTTAVSGYCISSCSRMFLGGKQRLFTDDYPADRTYVGFHGHYGADGNLDR